MLYAHIHALKQFCTLDYYAALKAFDRDLVENNFDQMPIFSPLPKQYASDFSMDFANCAVQLASVENWEPVITFLSSLPGYEEFDTQFFYGTVSKISQMSTDGIFDDIAQLVKHDSSIHVSNELNPVDIVRPFQEELFSEFRTSVQDLVEQRRAARIEELLDRLFGDTDLPELKFYVEEESKLYTDRGINGFAFCRSLSYLNAFYKRYLSTEMSAFINIFEALARCSDTDFLAGISTVFRDLQDLSTQLIETDARLDIKYPEGFKMKSLLDGCLHDEKMALKLNMEINNVNAKVMQIIDGSLDKFNTLLDRLQKLYDDRTGHSHVLVSNWPELDKQLKVPSRDALPLLCSRLKDITFLLNNYVDLH